MANAGTMSSYAQHPPRKKQKLSKEEASEERPPITDIRTAADMTHVLFDQIAK